MSNVVDGSGRAGQALSKVIVPIAGSVALDTSVVDVDLGAWGADAGEGLVVEEEGVRAALEARFEFRVRDGHCLAE